MSKIKRVDQRKYNRSLKELHQNGVTRSPDGTKLMAGKRAIEIIDSKGLIEGSKLITGYKFLVSTDEQSIISEFLIAAGYSPTANRFIPVGQ